MVVLSNELYIMMCGSGKLVHGWGSLVLEMCNGAKYFNFFCQPSSSTFDAVSSLLLEAQGDQPPAEQ
jgi:hypothetical protein